MVTKKVFKESLNTPESLKGTAKLAAAMVGGTLAVKWLQRKKYIPTDPFTKK